MQPFGSAPGGETIPLGWDDERVGLHSYVAFYHSTPEALRRTHAFIRTGLDEAGTFCIFLAEEARIPGLLDELQSAYEGDVQERIASGKLVAASWNPNFEGLVDTLMGRLDRALGEGYVRIRAMGLVAWARVGWGDHAWLKRCERAIMMATSMYPMVLLCTYHLPELPEELVREIDDPDHPKLTLVEPMGPLRATMMRTAVSVARRVPGLRL